MGKEMFFKYVLPHVAAGSVVRRFPYSYPVMLQSLFRKGEMFPPSVIFAFIP